LNKIANILFLDVPAGVGFSTVDDPTYQYTDINTGSDTYTALLEWFKAYTDFQSNDYWIGGESYSGMYVPYTA
jgi:carboxypeptidase C (cathepsin A)